MRFVVGTTMGISGVPYRKFLPWLVLGGVTWAVYTCGLAYLIGTALAEFPLASVAISGIVTTIILAALFMIDRRNRRQQAT